MKVRELIKELQKADPDMDVVCSTEDKDLLPDGYMFRLFEIADLEIAEAEKCRSEDGVASFRFVKSGISEKHLIINITSDF